MAPRHLLARRPRQGHRRAPRRGARAAARPAPSSTSAAAGARSRSPWPCAPPRPPCGRSTSTSGRSTSPAATPTALGLDGVRATTADGIPDDVRFDLIWSNPPIRVGKAVLHELLRTWLPRLDPERRGPPRRAAQPRLGHPAALDRHRARDAVHPAHLEQGLPGARGEAAMTESTTPALGVVLVPTLPPEALRPLAAAADRHLDELWLWEDCFKESSIAAAGRGPGLDRAGAGRHRPGAGAAAQRRAAGDGARHPAPALPRAGCCPASGTACRTGWARSARAPASPLTLLREHAEALRLLLDGARGHRLGSLRHPRPGAPGLAAGARHPAARRRHRPAHPRARRAGGRRHPHRLGRLGRRARRRSGRGAGRVGRWSRRRRGPDAGRHPPDGGHRAGGRAAAHRRAAAVGPRRRRSRPGRRRRRPRPWRMPCAASPGSAPRAWCSSPPRTSRTSRGSWSSSGATSGQRWLR